MTDELIDDVSGHVEADAFPELPTFPAGFDRVLGKWSARGPVAYVAAEYFGGVGVQAAAVWHRGELVLGPLTTVEDSPIPSRPPISQALHRLGASADDYIDEFEAVGLGRHRDNAG
jgi:hypothetical protein